MNAFSAHIEAFSQSAGDRPKASKRAIRITIYLGLLASDLTCVMSAFIIAALLRFGGVSIYNWQGVIPCVLALFMICSISLGAYASDVLARPGLGITRAITGLVSAFGLILFLSYFLRADAHFSRVVTAVWFGVATVSIGLTRSVGGDTIRRRLNGQFTSEIMLCDDVVPPHASGCQLIRARELGLRPDASDGMMLLQFARIIEGADRVIVACSQDAASSWATMLKGAKVQGEILVGELNQIAPIGIGQVDGCKTLVVSRGPLNLRQRLAKRMFDLALAVPALMVLLPLFALIALAIRLESPGPALFTQWRVGRGNMLFQIFKFRTMRQLVNDAEGHKSTSRDDHRVTRVGRFLRMTSIDELPQLLNVLLGSMSIVGPRPHALGSLAGGDLFWQIDNCYSHRHALKPGITGLAQVRGHRGTTHTHQDLKSRLGSDLEYISEWSLWRDIKIIFQTARVMVHANAY